jgi:hypothetical protein
VWFANDTGKDFGGNVSIIGTELGDHFGVPASFIGVECSRRFVSSWWCLLLRHRFSPLPITSVIPTLVLAPKRLFI